MPVPSTMSDLSTTASSNSPAGSENPISTDDFHRAIQAILRHTNAKGSDIASSSSIDLGAATGEFVDVTGTTTITALGTIAAGIERTVRFTGALTLTHNATSLILPTSANITTANGDVAMFRSLGSGNWKCVSYIRQNGTPLANNFTVTSQSAVTAATDDYVLIADTSDSNNNKKALVSSLTSAATTTTAGIVEQATDAEAIAFTDGKFPDCGNIQAMFNATGSAPFYACRAWVNFNGTGTLAIKASGNVSSVTDNGTGDFTINFTTSLPDANYAVAGFCNYNTATKNGLVTGNSTSVKTSAALQVFTVNNGSGTDVSDVSVSVFR